MLPVADAGQAPWTIIVGALLRRCNEYDHDHEHDHEHGHGHRAWACKHAGTQARRHAGQFVALSAPVNRISKRWAQAIRAGRAANERPGAWLTLSTGA